MSWADSLVVSSFFTFSKFFKCSIVASYQGATASSRDDESELGLWPCCYQVKLTKYLHKSRTSHI